MNIIISRLVPKQIVRELNTLGINTIKAGKSININNETAYHPDMLFYKLSNGSILTAKQHNFNYKQIPHCIHYVNLNDEYPKDCILNCIRTARELICGKNAHPVIIEDAKKAGLTIEYVKQGYVACSVVRLNCEAYICSDIGIYNKLVKLGFDALLVETTGIRLNGYSCGFIGGTALAVNKEMIAFSGKVSKYKDFSKISAFCKNYNITVVELSNDILYDYGGYIQL